MRFTRWLSPLFLLLLLNPIGAVRAQALPRTLTRAFDLSLGLGYGFGGPALPHRALIAAGGLVSQPARPLRHGALVVGVNASLNLTTDLSSCLNEPAYEPQGCRDYPSHGSLSALGGWAQRDDQGSGVRLLAGPGYFRTSDYRNGLGFSARVDGAERVSSHLSFVFWAQGQMPPSRRGERLSTLTAGIGLRVR